MLGIIPRPMHAVLDYLWGVAHSLAPEALGFADDEAANVFSKARGGSMIGTSMITRYELGLVKLIPYNVHLLLDLSGALAAMAAPWMFGFEKNEKARNAVIGFALFELCAVVLSKRDP